MSLLTKSSLSAVPTTSRFGRSSPWVVLIIVALAVPTIASIWIGPIRLSPYKAVLIASLFYTLPKIVARPTLIDVLVLICALLHPIALAVHHDALIALEGGGSLFLELFGSYCLGRVFITDLSSYIAFARSLGIMVTILAVVGVAESLMGSAFLMKLVHSMFGSSFQSPMEPRFGFTRAYTSFDHPILWGLIASVPISMNLGIASINRYRRSSLIIACGCLVGTVTSISTGPLAGVMAQVTILGWRVITPRVRARWLLLFGLLSFGYFVIGLLSNRSGLRVLLSYLTFSPSTANTRLIIWEWGFWHNAVEHPLLGIGRTQWVRPPWMKSDSMDNFWLVTMVTHGVPSAIALILGVGLSIRKACVSVAKPHDWLALGWIASMMGLAVAAATVHLWNHAFAMFGLTLGAGGWFATWHPTSPASIVGPVGSGAATQRRASARADRRTGDRMPALAGGTQRSSQTNFRSHDESQPEVDSTN
jgi:hypothetical protein